MVAAAEHSASFVITCYVCSFFILALFATTAVYLTFKILGATSNTTLFITARRTQPAFRVAWSFYASSIGAWAIFLPASYTSFGGWLSIISYAVATGLPLLLIAEWGSIILRRVPDVSSLNDYARRRYGPLVHLFVVVLSLVNMCLALIAEYTAIGDLFEYYVRGSRVAIIIFTSTVTSIYTAAGGLLVSILTDQSQAILSICLIVVCSLFLAREFRPPNLLDHPLPPNLATNYSGWSSVISLPISLLSAAIYSETFWQRVWAAEDSHSLRFGGVVGFLLTTVVIAFFGLVGFLGQWAEMEPLDANNNLAFFTPFVGSRSDWVGVVLVVLAATMNESAVDSLQNAIVGTISSSFFLNQPVYWSRVLVFVCNVPLMVVALQGYRLLDLLLVSNVLTTCSSFPLIAGIWLESLSSTTVLFSSAFSLFCTCLLGYIHEGSLGQGIQWVFSSSANQYDYKIFVVALLSSAACTLACCAVLDRRRRRSPAWGQHSGHSPSSHLLMNQQIDDHHLKDVSSSSPTNTTADGEQREQEGDKDEVSVPLEVPLGRQPSPV